MSNFLSLPGERKVLAEREWNVIKINSDIWRKAIEDCCLTANPNSLFKQAHLTFPGFIDGSFLETLAKLLSASMCENARNL